MAGSDRFNPIERPLLAESGRLHRPEYRVSENFTIASHEWHQECPFLAESGRLHQPEYCVSEDFTIAKTSSIYPTGQRLVVASHLKRHGSITAAEAYELSGILRLAARICELRHAGMNIHCVRVSDEIHARRHERLGKYILLSGGGQESPSPATD